MEFEMITRYIKQESARIRRPANAFMLYANHNRKKMAQMYPLESNKEISKRLGNSWKELDSVEKLHYYELAKQVDIEHKRKYPDYVYNPKEARIRKAMREASRERALSVAPMSPRTVRRPASTAATITGPAAWNFTNEDQLMMVPSGHGMRGNIIGPPMCSSSGFPIQANGNGPFAMQSMHYNKHMHPITHSTGTYMQANTIGQIPQQPDLWQPYEDTMRNTPGPYILPPQVGYSQAQNVPSPAMLPHMEKTKMERESFSHAEDSQSSHTNENVPPNGEIGKMTLGDPVFENKVDSIQPLMDSVNMHNNPTESFMPSYADGNVSQSNSFDKNEAIKLKKTVYNNINEQKAPSATSASSTFGKSSDTRHEYDYHRAYIKNYLLTNNCQGIEILLNENGICQSFNYATYNNPQVHSYDYSTGGIDINDILMLGNWTASGDECENDEEILNLSTDKEV